MIVVTAPTSAIGRQVVDNLLAAGETVRIIARDPARLAAHVRDRVDVVQGSHGDAAVVNAAFTGADAVFWLPPPNPKATSVEAVYLDFASPACAAFKSAGVKRVVGISALGRGTAVVEQAGLVTASLKMDYMIASTGVSYRALTMPSFMDNLLRQVAAIKGQGAFFMPLAGDRKVSDLLDRRHRRRRHQVADRSVVEQQRPRRRAWPGRPVVRRYGGDHVRGVGQANPLPADLR
jgi:uncharacterized protein YbjT (DUF2867 family)